MTTLSPPGVGSQGHANSITDAHIEQGADASGLPSDVAAGIGEGICVGRVRAAGQGRSGRGAGQHRHVREATEAGERPTGAVAADC